MSYEWYRRLWWMMGYFGGLASGLTWLALYLEPEKVLIWLIGLIVFGALATVGYINNALDAQKEKEDE